VKAYSKIAIFKRSFYDDPMTSINDRSPDDDGAVALAAPRTKVPSWTFLTNHAHVLVAVSRDSELRQRDIAHVVGITQGAVTRILADLEASGCISHERIGRRNRYSINADATLRHPLESAITIGQLIEVITG
jgi:hypothetical protein